jgi:hypothetical protein
MIQYWRFFIIQVRNSSAELIDVILKYINIYYILDFGSCKIDDNPIIPSPSCTVESSKPCFDYEVYYAQTKETPF